MQSGFAILLGWAIIIGIWLFYHLTGEDERRGWFLDFKALLGVLIVIAGVIETISIIYKEFL